ncbi:MAG TPA: RtcB family protein [Thermodesulfobacteriota bacterium]|nr:RtcB family protein [Thermodesulfobacteriota bacterium]
MSNEIKIALEKIDDYRWRIPRQGSMRTDGIVYADDKMMKDIEQDQSLLQVANVATLPGIVKSSLAMPDIHWGYGFPIGGVAAFAMDTGIISPGGVGYDINCGVRLLRTSLVREDVQGSIKNVVTALFCNIPSGVGSTRKDVKVGNRDLERVLAEGVRWAIKNGYGSESDQDRIEGRGCIPGADPEWVSGRARERGRPQLGTLGSGNHFVEVGFVDEVYDERAARVFGLAKDGITVLVHTGSRGLGHQVCDDFITVMLEASRRYGIELPDKQLCCAPINSPEGKRYRAAMACAANFAFVNRQMITHWVRESFEEALHRGPRDLGMEVIYDICHNIAKVEVHDVDGKKQELCVHRKGATRAFPPGHPEIPREYREVGQPVLIPGDMGRYSYVLVGTSQAYAETFGSACHGAGRVLSRHQAQKAAKGRSISRELEDQGIVVSGASRATLVEEMPEAYKDVENVVNVVHHAGIGKKVVRLRPLGVIKG